MYEGIRGCLFQQRDIKPTRKKEHLEFSTQPPAPRQLGIYLQDARVLRPRQLQRDFLSLLFSLNHVLHTS